MIEKVFKRRSEEVNHEDIVKALLAEIVDVGDASYDALAGHIDEYQRRHLRHPTRILYVRYSSRNCGASLFLGS